MPSDVARIGTAAVSLLARLADDLGMEVTKAGPLVAQPNDQWVLPIELRFPRRTLVPAPNGHASS